MFHLFPHRLGNEFQRLTLKWIMLSFYPSPRISEWNKFPWTTCGGFYLCSNRDTELFFSKVNTHNCVYVKTECPNKQSHKTATKTTTTMKKIKDQNKTVKMLCIIVRWDWYYKWARLDFMKKSEHLWYYILPRIWCYMKGYSDGYAVSREKKWTNLMIYASVLLKVVGSNRSFFILSVHVCADPDFSHDYNLDKTYTFFCFLFVIVYLSIFLAHLLILFRVTGGSCLLQHAFGECWVSSTGCRSISVCSK